MLTFPYALLQHGFWLLTNTNIEALQAATTRQDTNNCKDLLNHTTQVPGNNCKGVDRFYHQSLKDLPKFIEDCMPIYNSFVKFLRATQFPQYMTANVLIDF